MKKIDDQARDWEVLAVKTITEGYFWVPGKPNPEADDLLGGYHSRWGIPFNLANPPEGASVNIYQERGI